ncbi:hypothetical protein NC651_014762 [Populus alba x Populus x berolinensis]|nr:hypothetical protein NC651_014762 [Populus alba x Populus x berolinensis]
MEIMKRKVVGDEHLFQGKKIQAKLPVKPSQLWLYLWSYLLPKIRCCCLLYDLYFSLFMDFLLSPVSCLLPLVFLLPPCQPLCLPRTILCLPSKLE